MCIAGGGAVILQLYAHAPALHFVLLEHRSLANPNSQPGPKESRSPEGFVLYLVTYYF